MVIVLGAIVNAEGVPVPAGLQIRIDTMQFRIQHLQKNLILILRTKCMHPVYHVTLLVCVFFSGIKEVKNAVLWIRIRIDFDRPDPRGGKSPQK
jgi:hypothetical protein